MTLNHFAKGAIEVRSAGSEPVDRINPIAVQAGKRYEDWELDDPAGHDLDRVRLIRDQVRRHVEALMHSSSHQHSAPRRQRNRRFHFTDPSGNELGVCSDERSFGRTD